tara:strand:+ start:1904 stop:3112 length:1209 start_codon:yes stop_codon:yes gene_type:complete
MAGIIKSDGVRVSNRGKQGGSDNINTLHGIYIAEVITNADSLYTGRITVRIADFGSKDTETICLLAVPFGGHTKISDSGKDVTLDSETPVSYGMWPQPPEVGTNVVVAFTSTVEQGIVIGSLIAKDRNAMMGGRSSGNVYANGDVSTGPAMEKNPHDNNDPDAKPLDTHLQSILNQQGLSLDYVRGHSQSSARRESPSKVFGITTRDGHVFTLDDGDETGASKNIRLRTKDGAQILLDDSKGFIFVTTQSGDAWIEMNNEGKVDIYSKGGVNVHTEGDYNVHAKGSINMQAEQGVNIKSTGNDGIKMETTIGGIDVYSALDIKMESAANYHLLVAGNQIIKGTRIDFNGSMAPDSATKTTVQNQTVNDNVLTSVASRVPEHHPWLGVNGVEEKAPVNKGRTA